jgi:hypothetical protein
MSQATIMTELFADQTVDLLPERTTMYHCHHGGGGNGTRGLLMALMTQLRSANVGSQNGNIAIAIAINVGNVNVGGTQINSVSAVAIAGSNVAGA